MNDFEVYKPNKHEEPVQPVKPEKPELNGPKSVPEQTESKEQLDEKAKFKSLCVDYHKWHSKGWDMNSYAIDVGLYERFKDIKVGLLPLHLKYVYTHRLAYVRAISELGNNEKIRKFVLKFQNKIGQNELQINNFNNVYRMIASSPEYKNLQKSDFVQAQLALKHSIRLLKKIPKQGNWGAMARKDLSPDIVDDQDVFTRLTDGFELLEKNVTKLMQKQSGS